MHNLPAFRPVFDLPCGQMDLRQVSSHCAVACLPLRLWILVSFDKALDSNDPGVPSSIESFLLPFFCYLGQDLL